MSADPQRILEFAQASAAAYQPAAGARVIQGSDSPVLVLTNFAAHETIFAFKGTADVRMALRDGEVILKHVPGGGVHTGVERGVQSIYWEMRKYCREVLKHDRKHQFWFTGHSYGGGCAPRAAYLMAISPGRVPVAGVVTFGGMRFCDATFRGCYNTVLGEKTIRVSAQYDVVPHLPLPGLILNYRHVRHERYIQVDVGREDLQSTLFIDDRSSGQILRQDWQTIWKALRLPVCGRDDVWNELKANHSIERYVKLLGGVQASAGPVRADSRPLLRH